MLKMNATNSPKRSASPKQSLRTTLKYAARRISLLTQRREPSSRGSPSLLSVTVLASLPIFLSSYSSEARASLSIIAVVIA